MLDHKWPNDSMSQSLNFQSANQVFDVLNPMSRTPAFQVGDDALGCARVEIAGRPNLDCCRAGEHEFHHISSGCDPAHADHGDTYRMCCLIDHAECNRL